ncbi:protein PIN-LIKES 7-like [Bidens hawaiensis]|uniref:protein PIN-LIKES 7-like n=1 Tax=Bidens hawaiensis TaxID=980011 RepID=UPI004049622A
MGFWTLFQVASMPTVQVIIVSLVGALMATQRFNLLSTVTRGSLNKIVFVAFTPSLVFACLAETVTFQDMISWWFMPVNIAITFLCGGILGWIAVKMVKPQPHIEGLVIAMCSTGNLGNILLLIIPAICTQKGSPFGEHDACKVSGLSYSSFSMALGCFFIWTYAYQLIRNSAVKLNAMKAAEDLLKKPNKDLDSNEKSQLLHNDGQSSSIKVDPENPTLVYQQLASKEEKRFSKSRLIETLNKLLEELLAPPTIGAIVGFIFGAVPWLKKLLIGDDAPLRVIQDSITLLGDGTLPCITLILGGNLIQGLRNASIGPLTITAIIIVRYLFLPAIGVGVIKAAGALGLLPPDPLFSFVLLLQFTVPPAMNISTMTQLFDVGQEECSVLTMWTYIIGAFALTGWSTVFMAILT